MEAASRTQDFDTDPHALSEVTCSSNLTSLETHYPPPQNPTPPRRIVRRRKPLPDSRGSSTIKAMSFVGLKNLFFKPHVVLVPTHSNSGYRSASDSLLSHASSEPLLGEARRSRVSRAESDNDDGTLTDVESQTDIESQNSKLEKANRGPAGFRITDARVISDATIGLSDGLTVPFALTAGLSALGSTKVVIYGGFAELIAGAISMGLGGYLGAKSEAASYEARREETQALVAMNPQIAIEDITEVFNPYNLPRDLLQDLTSHLAASPRLVDFIMQFQHCEEPPASSRAITSAITIALGYFLGGLLPLLPYFCVRSDQVYEGLYISIAVMVVALFIFGYVKTCVVVGWEGSKKIQQGCIGGVQMVVVGSAAAGAAMGLVKLFNGDESKISGA